MNSPNSSPRLKTETRSLVRPYDVRDNALEECDLKPEVGEADPMVRNGWYLEDNDVENGMSFESQLEPDWDAIERISGVPVANLRLSIALRKGSVRLYSVLAQWPAEDHPIDWSGSIPPMIGTGFEIVYSVSLSETLTRLRGKPHRASSVVASRRFSFSSRGHMFDIEFRDFGVTRWGDEALWYVDVGSPNAPPTDSLTIYLNERLSKYYDTRRTVSADAKRSTNQMIAAGIYVDVACETLRQVESSTDPEPGGTLATVLLFLERGSGRTASSWITLAKEDPHEFTRNVQQQLQLASKL